MSSERPEEKREYEKPSVRVLSLVAEEVMAVGCKLHGSGGPNPAYPTSCILPGPCINVSNVS